MGRLKDFLNYLNDRHTVLHKAETRLCKLQEKYESYFAEVSQARESELEQLIDHTLADRGRLPDWFNAELDRVQQEVERDFDQRLEALETQRAQILDTAEAERKSSFEAEKRVKLKNRALDNEEERLKERSESLLARITAHNQRIESLGKGFGFFVNFFRMRKLAAEKKVLDAEQADVAARIESLRTSWKTVAQDHADKEHVRRIEWVEKEAEAASLSTKIEALRANRHHMVIRSTLERVLDAQERASADPAEGSPTCPRCEVANPPGNHFCYICARRLGEDRPDFDGSLEEIAEINDHFARFSEGMKACQEIIGLVRGLKTGVEAFTASVREVKSSEDKYPLPKLELEVPPWSMKYGEHFDNLEKAVQRDLSLHPKVFAAHVNELVGKVFTEEYIKVYFETMGEELSRQAAAQWE